MSVDIVGLDTPSGILAVRDLEVLLEDEVREAVVQHEQQEKAKLEAWEVENLDFVTIVKEIINLGWRPITEGEG